MRYSIPCSLESENIICNGEILEDKTPEKATKEAYDIAFELRPSIKEYYELVDGNYKYKEEEY